MTALGMTFINGAIDGGASSLRIVGSRIASVGVGPDPGDRVIDLDGDRLLPGLINAHDHLQLNGFGRLKYRARYTTVGDWIADVAERLQTSSHLKACEAVSREHRLLLGGIKNLLSGVTTVAHHDPLYGCLLSDTFPVSVMSQYGWSHSLPVDGEQKVRHSYRSTPAAWPWIIHAAEGLDEATSAEFDRLDALGCINPNTLIVHGVALNRAQRRRLLEAGAGLIWCPASNRYLFEQTAETGDLIEHGRVALGTDSRLSGARDLLTELKVARETGGLDDKTLQSLVTTSSAQLLRLFDRGVLQAGAVADILVLPGMALADASRADLRLVLSKGQMLYADREYASAVAPASSWVDVSVDGRPKVMDRQLAMLWAQSGLREPGFEAPSAGWKAA